jgi:PAS domain S-box-containing protein
MAGDISQSVPAGSGTHSPELQLIYETAPIGLAFLSPDCRYLMINNHLTEICGISVEGHIGRTVRETVPQVAEQVEQIVQTILQTGEPITGIEVNGQRPDGSNSDRVWITYWHPLKDSSGAVLGVNVAAEEITERKRAEAELAASQQRLRDLNEELAQRVEARAQERDRVWNLSQDLLVVFDADGNALNVNPAWQAMLGWSSEDLVGKSLTSLVHADDRARSALARANLMAGRKTRHLENRMTAKDGSYRWLSWVAVPDRGLIYATGRDITGIKQAQEQLRTLRRELAVASRQATMGAMTASIAHEIKQPLAVAVINADAALRWLNRPQPDLAEVRDNLDHIIKAGHRVTEVIDSIRALFGKDTGEASPVDVRLLVSEVLALAQGEMETHHVVLRDDVGEGLPPVMATRVQLQQVILNLVINAIEAMSAVTGRERCLTIATSLDPPGSVTITVADTGTGIDPAYRNRIFDPFFTTKDHGMGLGLAICRSIIEAHGGTLRVSSRDPVGTVFHLTLPVRVDAIAS